MISLTHDSEILDLKIREIFGDLETKGFIIQNALLKHTDAIGNYAEVVVKNKTTGRSILFWYIPPRIHPGGISIFLQNDSGDTFSLSEYLTQSKLGSQLSRSIVLSNYDGKFEENIESLLKASKAIIFQYLDKYLFGGDWEPIPIQWGDMK